MSHVSCYQISTLKNDIIYEQNYLLFSVFSIPLFREAWCGVAAGVWLPLSVMPEDLGLLGAGSMHPDDFCVNIFVNAGRLPTVPFGVNIPLMYPQIEEIMDDRGGGGRQNRISPPPEIRKRGPDG